MSIDLARGRELLAAYDAAPQGHSRYDAGNDWHAWTLDNAEALLSAASRVAALEEALRKVVKEMDDFAADNDGRGIPSDVGCIDCTLGTVPNSRNTGLCGLHAARRALAGEP